MVIRHHHDGLYIEIFRNQEADLEIHNVVKGQQDGTGCGQNNV